MDDAAGQWLEPLPPLRGFMFDVDGTLLLSDRQLGNYQLLPGSKEVLTALKASGIPFVLLTNGSAYPPQEQAAKMRAAGLPVEDWQMLTPSSVAADYLVRKGVRSALILGSPGVGHALREAGIEIRFTGEPGAEDVDAVYVGWHPACGMKDIESAVHAIWKGAGLYVASSVPFFATKSGRSIGYSHAITAAIRSLADVKPIITGKPSPHAMRFVARKLGVPIKSIGVVGDDPELEPAMARKAGAVGFGVVTGIVSASDWAAQTGVRRPHRVLQNVGDLLRLGVIEGAAAV